MKLKKSTINMFKSYSNINKSMKMDKGSDITICNIGRTIVSSVTLDDSIPNDFAVYDLVEFLGAVDLMDKSTVEFEFGENSVQISDSQGQVIDYTYGSTDVIVSPPEGFKVELPTVDVKLTLTDDNIKQVKKVRSVLSVPLMKISDKGITLYSPTKSTKFDMSVDVDVINPSDDPIVVNVDQLRMIDGCDYNVECNSELNVIKLEPVDSEYENLKYLVAGEANDS